LSSLAATPTSSRPPTPGPSRLRSPTHPPTPGPSTYASFADGNGNGLEDSFANFDIGEDEIWAAVQDGLI
jgi:hypothetical protein